MGCAVCTLTLVVSLIVQRACFQKFEKKFTQWHDVLAGVWKYQKFILAQGQVNCYKALVHRKFYLSHVKFVLFVLLLYVPSQQLWSLRDGQFI